MSEGEVPRVLYKYTSAEFGIQIFSTQEVKVTPPAELNDPFEFAPVFSSSLSRKQLKRIILNPRYVSAVARRSGESRRELRKTAHAQRAEIADRLVRNTAGLVETANRALDLRGSESGLLCLSGRADGGLLWAHYASSHQGVAVGFDSGPWQRRQPGFLKVLYSESRPIIDLACSTGAYGADPSKMILAAVSTKSPEWAYEEEYRAIISLPRSASSRTVADRILYFFKIAPVHVREVVLGARISSTDETRMRTILLEPCWSHVRLRRSVLAADRFAVDIVDA